MSLISGKKTQTANDDLRGHPANCHTGITSCICIERVRVRVRIFLLASYSQLVSIDLLLSINRYSYRRIDLSTPYNTMHIYIYIYVSVRDKYIASRERDDLPCDTRRVQDWP